MPWTCTSCQVVVDDGRVDCSACGRAKSTWTVVAQVTRTMQVPRRKFTLRRGVEGADVAAPETEPTTEGRVLDKARVEALRARGVAPAPRDTLYVALAPSGSTDLTVRGEVLFAARPSEAFEVEVVAPPDLPKDAVLLVPLVLVRGARPAIARDAFPGVTVLDVDEPTPDGAPGHAPTLEVEALGRPAQAVPLVPSTGVARGILGDLFFETGKTFLLPAALSSLRMLVSWYAVHAGHEVLVVGHADAAGDAGFNATLSSNRALAVAAYLRDDVDAWLAWYDAGWGTREDQHMLSVLADADGLLYAAAVDGQGGPATTDAVRRFQAWSNAARGTSLDVDGACGPMTRRELVAAYMAQDGTTLPEGTPVVTFGCGEWFPAVETADGVSEAANRRVDLMFFPDGVDPRPTTALASGPDDPHYPAWLARIVEEIGFEDRPDAYELLVAVDRAEDRDDRFELASSDGAYLRTLGLPDGVPSEWGVLLYFEGLPDGPTFTLTHLPDAGRRIGIFEGATRASLLAPRPAPPVLDPPAPPGAPPEEPWTGDPALRFDERAERVPPSWVGPMTGEGSAS